MATSKELRERLRRHLNYTTVSEADCTCPMCLVVRLLDALDAEEAERQAHAERLVGMARLVQLPPLAPLPYDDEGDKPRVFNPDGGEMICRVTPSPDPNEDQRRRLTGLLASVLHEVRSRLPESLVKEIEEELK